MRYMQMQSVIVLVILITVAGFAPASIPTASADYGSNPQDLPPICDSLEVSQENRFAFRHYAVGVQVYRWNGASWTFVEPVATLFADDEYHLKVGTHYGGPTWQGNDGSKVVATRVGDCSPDPAAIPWLLLQAASTEGPGIFKGVTYIQRVNTKGGLAPTAPGSSIGVTAQVPYTTEYYFYRARH